MFDRRLGDPPRAEDVVFDGRKNMPFHHRNMLVGGGVIQNGRLIAMHHPPQSFGLQDVPYLRVKHQMGKGLLQLPVNLKERRFRLIEADQGNGIEASNLPADL